MTRNDIVTVSYVDGAQITAYMGTVFAYADSFDMMMDRIVEQGKEREATMVINFQVNISGLFYGHGTAVRVEKA